MSAAARRLGGRLRPAPTSSRRIETVTAVGAGTVDLAGGDGDLPDVPHLASLVPAVGDRVQVEVAPDGLWLVTGIVDDGNSGNPWRSARGLVPITVSGTATASAAVVFPADRFTLAPIITLGKNSNGQGYTPEHSAVTAAGFTARVASAAGVYSGTINVTWRAEQATPTSAAG